MSSRLPISYLADEFGLSRRAIRFYIQRGLLSPPQGRGRAAGYSPAHVDRLRRILQLQSSGHSLEAIARILDAPAATPAAAAQTSEPAVRPTLTASLWTRVHLLEGVELQFDIRRHDLSPHQLLALRQAVMKIVNTPDSAQSQRTNS